MGFQCLYLILSKFINVIMNLGVVIMLQVDLIYAVFVIKEMEMF